MKCSIQRRKPHIEGYLSTYRAHYVHDTSIAEKCAELNLILNAFQAGNAAATKRSEHPVTIWRAGVTCVTINTKARLLSVVFIADMPRGSGQPRFWPTTTVSLSGSKRNSATTYRRAKCNSAVIKQDASSVHYIVPPGKGLLLCAVSSVGSTAVVNTLVACDQTPCRTNLVS